MNFRDAVSWTPLRERLGLGIMPNRYICEVLEEMRSCHKTRNYSYLLGLIEEAQSLANRMEAALRDKNAIETYSQTVHDLKAEMKTLKAEVGPLKEERKKLDADIKGLTEKFKKAKHTALKETKGGTVKNHDGCLTPCSGVCEVGQENNTGG